MQAFGAFVALKAPCLKLLLPHFNEREKIKKYKYDEREYDVKKNRPEGILPLAP